MEPWRIFNKVTEHDVFGITSHAGRDLWIKYVPLVIHHLSSCMKWRFIRFLSAYFIFSFSRFGISKCIFDSLHQRRRCSPEENFSHFKVAVVSHGCSASSGCVALWFIIDATVTGDTDFSLSLCAFFILRDRKQYLNLTVDIWESSERFLLPNFSSVHVICNEVWIKQQKSRRSVPSWLWDNVI